MLNYGEQSATCIIGLENKMIIYLNDLRGPIEM